MADSIRETVHNLCGGNEEPEFDRSGRVNKNNIIVMDGGEETIDIPNDGGDW